MQARGLNTQLLPVAGLRQANVPHMKFEVEILIFDPVRMIEPEWNIDEFLPERPRPVQPFVDMPQDRFEALRATVQSTLVIDLEAADVHRCPRRFEIQKRRVHCAELLHGRIPRKFTYHVWWRAAMAGA